MPGESSQLGAAVAAFNELNTAGLCLRLPIDFETVHQAASVAALFQRPDIADRLLAAYRAAGGLPDTD